MEDSLELPQKRERLQPKKADFRMRAHCNPLSDSNWPFPISPSHIDWSLFFEQNDHIYCNTIEHPLYFSTIKLPPPSQPVEIADVGCGYGGLLFALSKIMPRTRMLGMEIRNKVTNYVAQKIWASRIETNEFWNIGVLRANAMKQITNYFPKSSLTKLFFCFPDPHFKKSVHRRRIVHRNLLSEYAYVLKSGGKIYAITDVLQLHEWHLDQFKQHPLYKEVPQEEIEADPCVTAMINETEEGKKVERNKGKKYYCVYQRI
ncbi:TRM8 [Blepharisma stoltei]|uniref:tRNA (guanine-N(7)-)-methyltransferase n=1 Tax=Blepharisma stoltei TaxID=1481888 RepID=A0AAU9IHW2_9CILI|nr:unnamed protein product [Blepharisma stoltei]